MSNQRQRLTVLFLVMFVSCAASGELEGYKSQAEYEQYGAAFLKELRAEHKNIELKLGQERAC